MFALATGQLIKDLDNLAVLRRTQVQSILGPAKSRSWL